MIKAIIPFAAAGFLVLSLGAAFAHEGETHEKKHHVTRMERLHKIMPLYAQVQARINEALERGDSAAVEAETSKLLATTTDLKKSKPHKNIKQLKKFRSIAAGFERDIKATAQLGKQGDFAKAKDAFKKVEASCTECHALFRD